MISREKQKEKIAVHWVYFGVASGLVACILYPLVAFVPLPPLVTVFMAALFGPALAIASVGLCSFLGLHRQTVASQLGMIFNLLASSLVLTMFLVQLAVRMRPEDQESATGLTGVWLGLDVAWDVFLSLGTLCFAIAAYRHPRLGLVFAIPGGLVAGALLVLNLVTFPIPPGEAGYVDLGPVMGLWYLAITLRILFSLSWTRMAAFGAQQKL